MPTMAAMDQWQLNLDGLNQARSLHRMLMDRKFDGPADEFFGSPHIAAIQHRLADMIAAAEPGKGWDRWRQAHQHPDRVEQVRRHLQQLPAWQTMPPDTRHQFVQDLLAPLIPSEALLQELIYLDVS